MTGRIWIIGIISILTGCASIKSDPTTTPGDGLVYYLPKKDLIVTVTRSQAKDQPVITTASLETTTAYPELSKPYVLTYSRNLIGRNELHVGVTSTGLLTSTTSTTTSGVTEALKNLAASIGAMHGLAAPPKAGACPLGIFTYIYDLKEDISGFPQPCGIKITVKHVESAPSSGQHSKADGTSGEGIFYRQQEPFLVTAESTDGGGARTSKILLSPSKSGLRYLPIERTLFANNKADFAFEDGVPTKYDQNADGELIALFKLPADVIGAYFGAVGQLFSSFKDNSNAQVDALNADLKLQLAKQKYDACSKAFQQNNSEMVKILDCVK